MDHNITEEELEEARQGLLALDKNLPFQLVVSPVFSRPEIDPSWDEPEDFDWEADAHLIPYTGRLEYWYSVGWKWEYRGHKYGNFMFSRSPNPKRTLEIIIANFEHSKDAIKGERNK